MKKTAKKSLFAVLLAALMILSISTNLAFAEGETEPKDASDGFVQPREKTESVDHASTYYFSQKKTEKMPVTFEAWVYIPSDIYSQSGGVIIGNYSTIKKDEFVNFEIHTKGVPRLLVHENDGTGHDYKFSSAAVPADKWTHVAIVYGTGYEGKQIFCYINGELRQTTASDKWYGATEGVLDNTFILGGDSRTLNEQGFRGSLGDVTVYSDVRTHDEIASDMKKGADTSDDELLMAYKLFGRKIGENVPDISGNGYDMIYSEMWLTEEEMRTIRQNDDKEYAYSIAFLPDPQYSTKKYPAQLKRMFDYLLESKDERNVKYLITVGDLTENNNKSQWGTFKGQVERLNGNIPYSLVRGNHDVDYTEKAALMDNYFGKGSYYHSFVTENGGFLDPESSKNTYHLFSVGEVDYLILNLDFGAEDHVLEWADEVLTQYKDRRVIVSTHGYLNHDGTRLEGEDYARPSSYKESLNDADDLWDKFLRKHKNVDIIVSGHIPHDGAVYSTAIGDNGNVVHQFLLDTQSIDYNVESIAPIFFMYFTEDGDFARLECYSARYDKYLRGTNELIKLNFTDPVLEPPVGGETDPTPDPDEKNDETSGIKESSSEIGETNDSANNRKVDYIIYVVISAIAAAVMIGTIAAMIVKKRK